MDSNEFVTFDAAFEDLAPTIDKRLFKDAIIKQMSESGTPVIEIPNDGQGGDILLKRIDEHVSQGYNVFKSKDDYQEWMQQSLYVPSDEEVMANLKE